jgi:hypothetical protein
MVASLADGQSAAVRVEPQQVTSSTSPQRDRTLPATFTTTGTVVPPPSVPLICAPGVTDPAYCQGSKDCPPGMKDPAYCVQPPAELLCTGKMTVSFSIGGFTISSRRVDLRPDCTYRSRVTFISRSRFRRIRLTVSALFEGNDFLLPKSAPVHIVQIG